MRRDRATRRDFLKRTAGVSAAAVGFPYIVPASALGKDGNVAPSNRIVMAAIGTGGKGTGNMLWFQGQAEVQMVAVCDVETANRNKARDAINERSGNKDCKVYSDFRELLVKHKTDAVCVGTPDHWHALATIAAANAGNDVYCEKPLANSVAEGRAICDAIEKNKRVLQTGSQERSNSDARKACELVRNGRIGKLHTIRINLPCSDGHHSQAQDRCKDPQPEMPIPEGFDYNFWLGHTPWVYYNPNRCHFNWRWNLAYGGGEMTDRGAHVIDIAQLGNGTDDTGPIAFEAKGSRPEGCIYNTFFDYKFECNYANGVKMIGSTDGPRGLKFEGDKGSIFVHIHGSRLEADPASILDEKIGENELHLGRTPEHHRNFLDAVRSRTQPFAHAEVGHRTASLCHLTNIALLTGRKLKWDPEKEQFIGDDEANKLLSPPMRPPWHL